MHEEIKNQSIELKETCEKCGKSVSTENQESSITGWLFKSGYQSLTDRWACSCNNQNAKHIERLEELQSQTVDKIQKLESSDNKGNIVADYRLINHLGEGYLGNVFLAEHLKNKQLVALRIFNPLLGENKRIVKRLLQEAKKASQLTHRSIGLVYDYGKLADGTVYLVSEYIDGISLSEAISEEGFFDWNDSLEIFEQLAEALAEAHGNEVLHRTVKPTNIRVLPNGSVKLIDFGIERAIPTAGQITQCLSQIVGELGNPLYMSPEQVIGEPLSVRSDIYSLGCVMYEVLTGKKAFAGYQGLSAAMAQLNETPRPFSEAMFNSDIPAAVEQVVMKCLEKDPDNRYQNISDLLNDIFALRNNQTPKIVNEKPARSKMVSKSNHYPVKAQLENSVLYAGIVAFTLFFCYLANTIYSKVQQHNRSQIAWKKSSTSTKTKESVESSAKVKGYSSLDYLSEIEPMIDFGSSDDNRNETTEFNSIFSDSEIKKELPGTWNYRLYGKEGQLIITGVKIVDDKRIFSGILKESAQVLRVAGILSKSDDSLTMISDTGIKIPEGTVLIRGSNNRLTFNSKNDQEFGLYAEKQNQQVLSDNVFKNGFYYKTQNLEGTWRSTKYDTSSESEFEITNDWQGNILRIRRKTLNSKLGCLIVGGKNKIFLHSMDNLKVLKVWKDPKTGKMAMGLDDKPIYIRDSN